jgi:hypothetical protein
VVGYRRRSRKWVKRAHLSTLSGHALPTRFFFCFVIFLLLTLFMLLLFLLLCFFILVLLLRHRHISVDTVTFILELVCRVYLGYVKFDTHTYFADLPLYVADDENPLCGWDWDLFWTFDYFL